jgi:hypothetical protein
VPGFSFVNRVIGGSGAAQASGRRQDGFGSRLTVARTISNATSHPGKTFHGCACRIRVLDSDGAPLFILDVKLPRNLIERFFSKLKHFRRVATR